MLAALTTPSREPASPAAKNLPPTAASANLPLPVTVSASTSLAPLSRRPWLWLAVLVLIALVGAAYLWLRPPARTRLEFRHHWTGGNSALAAGILKNFAATHPEIDLQPIAVHNHWAKQYLVESMQNRTLPDVFTMSTALVAMVNQDDHLLPLEPLARATGDDLTRLFPARELDGLSTGGALRALPLSGRFSGATLLINLDVVDQAGLTTPILRVRTWGEFTELSRQLVAALNPPGELQIAAWNPLFDRGYPMVAALCYGRTPIISADGRTSLLDRPEVLPAWQAIEHYFHEVYGAHGGAAALIQWRHRHGGFALGTMHVPFAQGKVAFNFAGLPAIAAHRKINPEARIASRLIPGLAGPVLLPGRPVSAVGISRQSPNPAAAWQLVRYLTLTAEGNQAINLAGGTPSAIPALTDTAEYQRRHGAAWTEAFATTEHLPPEQILFEAEWNDQFNLEYLSRRATGEPLDRTIQHLHQMLQTWLDRRRQPAAP